LRLKDKDLRLEDKDLRLKDKDFRSKDLRLKDKDLWLEDKDLRLKDKDLRLKHRNLRSKDKDFPRGLQHWALLWMKKWGYIKDRRKSSRQINPVPLKSPTLQTGPSHVVEE